MSSVLSLFTQQAKETMGIAARTQDPDLLALMSRLFELDKDAQSLKKALQTMARVLLEQVPASRTMAANLINDIFAKTVPAGSPTMEALSSFNDAQQALNKDTPKKMEAAFDKAVLTPIDEWLEQLAATKKDLADVESKRITYDHYRSKLDALKEAKRKSLLRGKTMDKAGEERIQRNEEKLQGASTDYFTARDSVAGRILQLLREAPCRVETTLLRVIQFEKEHCKDSFVAVQRYEGVLPGLLHHVKERNASTMHPQPATAEACVEFASGYRKAEKPIPSLDASMQGAVETALKIPVGPGAASSIAASSAGGGGGKRASSAAPLPSVNSFSSVATTPAPSAAAPGGSWDAAFNGGDDDDDANPSAASSAVPTKKPSASAATNANANASRVSTTQATGSFFGLKPSTSSSSSNGSSSSGNPFGPAPTKPSPAAASATSAASVSTAASLGMDEFAGASGGDFGNSSASSAAADPWAIPSKAPAPAPAPAPAFAPSFAPAPAPAPAPTNPFSPGFGSSAASGGGGSNSLGAPPAAGRRRTTAAPAPAPAPSAAGGNPFGPAPTSSSSASASSGSTDLFGLGAGSASDDFNNSFNAAAPVPPPRAGNASVSSGGFDFLAPPAPQTQPPPSAPPSDVNDPFGGLM